MICLWHCRNCRPKNKYYKIDRIKNKWGSKSYIKISYQANCKKLLNYIYNNYENDKIGLLRKYNKYLEFETQYNNNHGIKL